MLCLNPVAWKLCSTEGYRLSRPIGSKVTNLLYIDDLKVFAASQAKLNIVLKMTKEAMEDIGLQWNPKKCNVLKVRRGVPVDIPEGFKSGETLIDSRKEDTTYRFLGAPERLLQEESWLCSVLPRPSFRDSRLSGRAHCQTPTDFKGPISLPCQCCRTSPKRLESLQRNWGSPLTSVFQHPKCRDNRDGADAPRDKIKRHLKKAAMGQRKTEVKEKKWQGKLLAARWEEDQLNQRGSFAWLKNWDTAPTRTIAGMLELYEQLTPTKVYYARNTQTNHPNDTLCRLRGKTAESIPHVLASCSALAQNTYLARHNAALKVLFWEMLRELHRSDTVPPWYSPAVPKPIYESPEAQAYWNIPVFAVSEQVKQNRVDARFIDHEKKKVLAVEMSCPWTENREKKQEEKTIKYGPLRWELKQQFQDMTSGSITSSSMS